ncbi:MAG: DUF4296 domain-containing protein [Bacteroidota bacterium]
MKILFLNLSVLLICFSSCRLMENASPVIPEDKFVRFYSDLLIIQNVPASQKPDTAGFRKSIDSLYKAYYLDTAQVHRAIAYYNQDIARWQDFYTKVYKQLEATAAKDTTGKRPPSSMGNVVR